MSDSKTKVISIYTNKGGTHKSTTTANLAYCLTHNFNKKVLVIDMDPQANLSLMLNFDVFQIGAAEAEGGVPTIASLLQQIVWYGNKPSIKDLQDTIISPTYRYNERKPKSIEWEVKEEKFGFDLIPGTTKDLSLIELAFMTGGNEDELPFILQPEGRQYNRIVLKMLVDMIKKYFDYDYILIDNPPSLGILAIMSLCASDATISPVVPDFLALVGLKTVVDNLGDLQQFTNNYNILGILLSGYNSNKLNDEEIKKLIEDDEQFADVPIFNTMIPERRAARKYNMEDRIPAQVKGDLQDAYIKLAEEVIERIEVKWQ